MMNPTLKLNTGRSIGPGHPAYIIAEIGSNHDGSLEKAKRLAKLARDAGADAVKIQSFQVGELINSQFKPNGQWEAHKAWDILDKLTVPEAWHQALQEECRSLGIDFLSTPFDEARLALLDRLNIPLFKIASGDLTHHHFLRQVGRLNKPVILSTGLAYLGEVEAALNVLSEVGCRDVALLHCVSLYPPSFADMNIRAMVTMAEAFKVPVGFSDHTPGNTVPLGAVALGACIIEKHMTDDKTLPGPDHPYALNVEEFTQLVTDIRNLEAALGDGIKRPPPTEVPERVGARRGVYVREFVPKGSPLTPEMLKVVRHAYQEGVPADHFEKVQGRVTTEDLHPDELLTWEKLTR
jgi:N,N'-diacetyllegionaminate synthase